MFEFLSRGLTGASVWQMLVVLVVVGQLTMASTTLYLHRSAAHRGVDFHPAVAHWFRFFAWLTTGMVTKEWAAIRGLERLGLAKVLRTAPELDVRPNIRVPDADTLKAMMVHRWQVATDYFQLVLKPHLQAEAAGLSGRMRRAFRSDGRWLDDANRAAFSAWIAERPRTQQLMDFRARLLAIYELRSAEAEAKLVALREWCAEAEASGIRTLEEFSARLKGYAMVPARA